MTKSNAAATKTVPVFFQPEICLWHTRRGPKDAGFTGKMGGVTDLFLTMGAIAQYNLQRLAAGKPRARFSLHTGLETTLFQVPGRRHDVYANLVNDSMAMPWIDLMAWLNDTTRSNYAGTPNLGGLPVAGFGREVWGMGGSYCSTEEWIRQLGQACWVESQAMLDDAKRFPWGQEGILIDWNGLNSVDIDTANPDEIVTNNTLMASREWKLQQAHLTWVARQLGPFSLEPKLFHPGMIAVGTTLLGSTMAKAVNDEVGDALGTVNIEDAHHWADGKALTDDGFDLLLADGTFVNRRGHALIHGNGGLKCLFDIAEALKHAGLKRGAIAPPPDMDYRYGHVTAEQRAEQKAVVKMVVEQAGTIPASWADVDKVVVTCAFDVRHAGFDNVLQAQTDSIDAFEADVAEAGGQLMPAEPLAA